MMAPPPGPPGTYFDQASGLWLPDGTELASTGRRIGAWLLGGVLLVVTLVIGYVIWSLVIYGRGQTPKMQVLNMRCYKPAEGRVADWGAMALREIVGVFLINRVAGGLTLIAGLVLLLTRGDKKVVQDLIAGTVVLHDPNKVLAPAG